SATAIQEGLSRVGVAAEQAGLSVETTTALLVLLAQKGIEGGRGAQALGTAIQDLANPASTAGRALEDLGISGDDFLGVLSRLQSDSTAAEEVLAALGNRPRAALQALLDQGGGALQQLIELIRNSAGASKEAARDLEGGFNFQIDRLLNAVAGVRDELAQPLLEPLADQAGSLATKLRELAASEGFAKLKAQIADFASTSAEAIGEFLEQFDFTDATNATATFVADVTSDLKEIRKAGLTVADGINKVAETLRLLKTLSDAVSLQPLVARLIETNNAITALADDAPAAAGGIDDLAAAGQRSGNVFTGLQRRIDDLRTAAGQRLQEALSATRQSIANVNDGVARSIPTLVQYETRIAAAAKAGDAAEVARLTAAYSKQKQELLQAAEGAGTLSERMVKLRASIAAALERGDTDKANGLAKRLAEIQREAQKADAELQKILAKNGVLTGQTGEIVAGNKKVADSNADVTESNAKVADSAQQVGQGAKQAAEGLKVQVSAADAARSAAQAIAARIKALREEFSFSAGAAEAFELRLSALNRAMLGSAVSTAIGQYQARLEGVGETIRRLIATQAEAADKIEANLGLAGAYGDLDTVIAQLRGLEAETRNVNGRFSLLSEQRLDQLRSQIRATTGDLQQTARQLDDLIDRLQDERDRRNNDQESIAKREYERELERIAELERTGGEAARRRAEEARRLARENHDAELREIRERAQADRDRDRERDEREQARQDRGRNERTQTSS
ncbi:MAG: phage tail tape measure protein, partial [Xanthomonadales bacterium]|nr:phage tail tape measure protein [Xanthomonadales bacterium]